MSRFVDTTELKKIDLGEGDWIKVPKRLSWEFVESLGLDPNSKVPTSAITVSIFSKLIKEWNLKDKDGNVADITAENIKKLDIKTMNQIGLEINSLMTVQKKSSIGSDEQSKGK